mmetsp:Transcript_88210/g.274164  ORF Transcript_88210/g.274164 Transcript_88210/m.274164 type:complete len:236 (-) Transcript_88210:153-860(-)
MGPAAGGGEGSSARPPLPAWHQFARRLLRSASWPSTGSPRNSSDANRKARGFCFSAVRATCRSPCSSGEACLSAQPSRSTAASTTARFPRSSSSSSLSSTMPRDTQRSTSNSCAFVGSERAAVSAPGAGAPGTGSRSLPKPTSAPSISIQPRWPPPSSPAPPPRRPPSSTAACRMRCSSERGAATTAPWHSSGCSLAQSPCTSTARTTSPSRRWPMEGAEVDFQARIATRLCTTR